MRLYGISWVNEKKKGLGEYLLIGLSVEFPFDMRARGRFVSMNGFIKSGIVSASIRIM